MSRELHINFLCLIVLGKLWRRRVIFWRQSLRVDPAKKSSYKRQWYLKNKSRVLEQCKTRYLEDRERIKRRTAEYYKRTREHRKHKIREYCKLYRESHRDDISAYLAQTKEHRRVVQRTRERRNRNGVSLGYVKKLLLLHNPELRGMELPAAFIESRKEVINAKRILRKYKRDQELGGQPSVLQDQA